MAKRHVYCGVSPRSAGLAVRPFETFAGHIVCESGLKPCGDCASLLISDGISLVAVGRDATRKEDASNERDPGRISYAAEDAESDFRLCVCHMNAALSELPGAAFALNTMVYLVLSFIEL